MHAGFLRPAVFALIAAAILLGALRYLPPLLRPGIPVWRVRELPFAVAGDLEWRGCNIVPSQGIASGDFDGSRGLDWAILCRRWNGAALMLYPDGAAPKTLREHSTGLAGDPEGARGIRAVGWDYVVAHNPAYQIDPALIPAACVEDAAGMGSVIHCYLGGWVEMAGAD